MSTPGFSLGKKSASGHLGVCVFREKTCLALSRRNEIQQYFFLSTYLRQSWEPLLFLCEIAERPLKPRIGILQIGVFPLIIVSPFGHLILIPVKLYILMSSFTRRFNFLKVTKMYLFTLKILVSEST